VTAAKTSLCGVPRATRVATLRSAACSFASRRRSPRPSAFATAIATISVNAAIWVSVFGGNGGPVDEAAITPHSRPDTMIGAPTDERIPRSSGVEWCDRTGRRVCHTFSATLSRSTAHRVPTSSGTFQPATVVMVPSGS
jgi:hypothetical protein